MKKYFGKKKQVKLSREAFEALLKKRGVKIIDKTNPENPTMTVIFMPKPKKNDMVHGLNQILEMNWNAHLIEQAIKNGIIDESAMPTERLTDQQLKMLKESGCDVCDGKVKRIKSV